MLISEKALQHWINHFYGYGSWQAPYWFVGYEEGGGDLPEEVADKFNYFSRVHTSPDKSILCDIRELYKNVNIYEGDQRAESFSNLYEHRFGADAKQNSYWKNLIAFEHGFENKKLPDSLKYQKQQFALNSSKEALIQLYPLPSSHNHAWYYSWLDMPSFTFLKNRALYEQHMYPGRMNTILQQIKLNKPKLVLMYGMNNINTLKQSVQDFFPEVTFKMVKGIKLQTPQHHLAEVDNTILIITTQVPGLRHNRVESGFDWFEFGKTLR